MRGDGSIGYRYLDTSHLLSHHCNDDGISDYGSIGVSVGNVIRGFRSQETIHYSSRNCGVYHINDQSDNDGRGGYRSQ